KGYSAAGLRGECAGDGALVGRDATALPGSGFRFPEHQQGLRGCTERDPDERARNEGGLRAWGGLRRRDRRLPDRPDTALPVRRIEGGRGSRSTGVWAIFRDEGRRVSRWMPYGPVAFRRGTAWILVVSGEGDAGGREIFCVRVQGEASSRHHPQPRCGAGGRGVCRKSATRRSLQPWRWAREQRVHTGSDREDRVADRAEIELAVCGRGAQGRSHLLHLESGEVQEPLSEVGDHAE